MRNNESQGVNMSKIYIVYFVCISCFLSSTISVFASQIDSPEIKTAFEKAGENSSELQKVIEYYKKSGEKQKLKALFFLIANMEEHSYATYRLFDSAGVDVNLDVLSFPNYDSLTEAVREIEKVRGEIDYEKTELIYDLTHITANFLINQIDYAFKAWKERPWAKNFDFDQFCRYILPYRGSNEPLEEWRKYFYDKYAHITDQMEDVNNPLEAATIINDDIKTWFGFDPRYYYHPTDQGLAEMIDSKLGRCEDMTNITIYAMRANGLAVTSDYTPYWANSGNNHAWNAIVTAEGEVIPFMGAEASPGSYKLSGKVGKVYRKTYDQQKDNLIFQVGDSVEIPRWLKGKNYMDVTADYTDVADVELIVGDLLLKIDRFKPYLAVFNSGEWKAIHWGKKIRETLSNEAVWSFTDMGKGVVYLPVIYPSINAPDKINYINGYSPFLLQDDGTQKWLSANHKKKKKIKLYSTTKRQLVKSTDGTKLANFENGKEYELFYWDDDSKKIHLSSIEQVVGWKSLGKQTAVDDKPLVFEDVPSGGLYWLVEQGSDKEERIFTIDKNGKQVWW